jgi:hypothetical protein
MELDPGPMANDNHSKSKNHDNCDPSTMCYDLVPSSLHSNRNIRHSLLKSFNNILGHAYHSLLPMVPRGGQQNFYRYWFLHYCATIYLCIWTIHSPGSQPLFTHSFSSVIPCHAFKQQACGHQYGEITSMPSPLMNTALQMKILV